MARTRGSGPGFTIPEAALELSWPEKVVRGGVKRGDIRAIRFNGLERIPPSEIARLQQLFSNATDSPPTTDCLIQQLPMLGKLLLGEYASMIGSTDRAALQHRCDRNDWIEADIAWIRELLPTCVRGCLDRGRPVRA